MRQAPKTYYDPIPKGHLHEYSLFGEIKKNNPKYLEAYKKAGPDVKGYLPFDKAFDLVKEFQPGDPTNPKAAFLRNLRIAVIDALGLTEDADVERVKAYTAVGSPLDHWHSADAVIEVESTEKGQRSFRITLDATLDEKKEGRPSGADILIGELPDELDDKKKYLDAIDELGKRIATILKSKQSKINLKEG